MQVFAKRDISAPAALTGLAERIDAALPQTQCRRCGYPDCRGYAQAVAAGRAGINQCPPGGAQGIARLAAITGRAPLALNPDNGVQAPRSLAFIDEDWCIGCTLCVAACPVDAIVGASKTMHTVIESCCTGCALCLPVCPVDCIVLENASGTASGWSAWSQAQAGQARQRYQRHCERNARADDRGVGRAPAPPAPDPDCGAVQPPPAHDAAARQARIAAALERARRSRQDAGD